MLASKGQINIESVICRNNDIEYTDVDSEKIMIDLEKGQYYALNKVASTIWNNIEKPNKVANIIDALMNKYEISYDKCVEEVMKFLHELRDDGLIFIS